MKIIMTKDEVIHAFLNSVKVRDAVLSYHGATNHEGADVAIEGEENYDDCYEEDGETELTEACRMIIGNLGGYNYENQTDFMSAHIPCIKTIREFTGKSLQDCKKRYDTWRENDYEGNV